MIYVNTRLFQKGAEEFEESEREIFVKHLLKSFGQDLLNILCRLQALEFHIQMDSNKKETMNHDERIKIIKQFPRNCQEEFTRLNDLLNDKEIDAFLDPLEETAEKV